MTRYYTFNEDGSVAKVYDGVEKYAEGFKAGEEREVRIGAGAVGPYWVSTVPLLIDHNFSGDGTPVLWETMIFGGEVTDEEYQERYTSVEAARDGHERAIRIARKWAACAVRENEEEQ